MSELVKSFVFDLQRFSETTLSTTYNKITAGAIPTPPASGAIYWAGGTAEVSATSNTKHTILFDKSDTVTAESGTATVTYTTVSGANAITLASGSGDSKLDLTEAGSLTLVSGVNGKSIYLGETGEFDGTGALQLTFGSATAASISVESGAIKNIYVPTVSGGTLTYTYAAKSASLISEAGLVVSDTIGAEGVSLSTDGTGWVLSGKDSAISLSGSNAATVASAGFATKLYTASGKTSSLTFGEDSDLYVVNNKSGNSYFSLASTGAALAESGAQFVFGAANDALLLTQDNSTLGFGYTAGTKTSVAGAGITLASETAPSYLTYAGSGAFSLNGLESNDVVSLGSQAVTFTLDDSNTVGAAVGFSATNSVINSVSSLKAGDMVSLTAGDSASSVNVTVNGSAVVASVTGFTYTYANSTNKVLNLEGAASIGSVGDANELTFADAVDSLKFGSSATIYGASLTAGDELIPTSYFFLQSGAIKGVVLGEAGDSVAVDSSTAANFGIYQSNENTTKSPQLLSAPGITNSAASVSYALTDDGYNIAGFKTGSKITGDVNISFAVGDTTSTPSVLYTASEDNATVYSLTEVRNFIAGDAVTVTGDTAGIKFSDTDEASELAVSVASGSYIYANDSVAGMPVLTLTETSDTVYGVGDGGDDSTTRVSLASGATSFNLSSDGEEVTAYGVTQTSGAYFVVDSDVKASAFNFGGAGNAISVGADGLGDLALTYLNDEETATITAPEITDETGFSVEMTSATADAQAFAIKGLDSAAAVTFDNNGETFTFGEDETAGAVYFDKDGVPNGVSLTTSVELSAEAAALLDTSETPFTINGSAAANIQGIEDAVTLTVEDDGLTLAGLAGGETVVNSGLITKIIAPADAIAFGESGDDQKEYTIESSGEAYFTLAQNASVPTSFVFIEENDAITGDVSILKLQDGATGTAFTAPKVYNSKDALQTQITVTKLESNFEITDLSQGDYIQFSDAKLTFQTLAGEDAGIRFDSSGNLVAVTGLDSGDAVKVEGATKAISFDPDSDDASVKILDSSFVYTAGDTVPTITEVTKGATIKQVAGASSVLTAKDSLANGAFTFADGSAFSLAGNQDGIEFIVNDSVGLSGVNSINGTESVSGALDGLTFNGGTAGLSIGDGSFTVFENEDTGNLMLDGLTTASDLTNAGGISDFRTSGEGTFKLFGGSMAIEDDEQVTFNTNGASALTGISDLEGTAIGSFSAADGLEVNGEQVIVTNDDKVAVTAGEDGITKVAQLGVDDATAEIVVTAGGASVFGVDKNGVFDFNGMGNFNVAGNGDVETEFDFGGETQAITGVDSTETLSGDFSTATKVDGKMLEVTNDENISLVGGKQILGLMDGAEVLQAEGISSAKTVEEAFEGTITIGDKEFQVTSVDGVEFLLDGNGAVVGISGIGEGEKVVGDLTGIEIDGRDPIIRVIGKNGEPNPNLTYENGTLSGVVDGDTVYLADNVTKIVTGGGSVTFKAPDGDQFFNSDSNKLTFAVNSSTAGVEATAVTDLDEGKSLEGAIAGLSVNGKTVDITNDKDFGVIGAAEGIDAIYNLSNGAVVADAAGATLASTDTEGTFTFAGGQSFMTAGDSFVNFTLDDKNAVTAIAGLSNGAVNGNFDGITTVNDQTFEVLNDNNIAVFADADGNLSKISLVDGGASIGEIGSVSQILTTSEGVFTFTKGNQEFTTSDGAKEVIFGTEESKVTSIDNLDGAVLGSFSGIQVNGQDIDIVDKDGVLKVIGNGEKLTAIEGVTADATINAAGGVSSLAVEINAESGKVMFGDGKEFVIAGDSAVTFGLNADAAATGVTGLGGTISGALSGLGTVNGQTFEVKNDDDFSIVGTADASNIAKLADISGGASIGQVGSVSQVLTDTAGKFKFTNGSWDVAGDSSVTFGLENSEVTSISELEGTVSGAFDDVTVNDAAVAISGDSSIAIVAGASGITEVQNLSGNAVISKLDGTVKATTDSDGLFTFADGQAISVSGDSEVVFNLVDGKLQSIDELDSAAVLTGDLNGVSIVGASAAISVEAGNKNLWYTTGTLSGVVNTNTVYGAADAETVKVATDGTFTFANGDFVIAGDKDGTADFVIAKGTNSVLAINGLEEGATVTGDLNGLSINGGKALNVENDDEFGAVAGDGTLAKLTGLGDGANVIAAGGASQFVTDEEGSFTILGTAMEIENDTGVTFTAGASGITAIDDLNGTANGDFTGGIAINGADNVVQVSGDSSVAVSSEGDTATRIANVTGSDAPTVVSAGGATEIATDAEGTFTFTTSGESRAFTTAGDGEVVFGLDEDGNVVSVTEFDEDGTLSFKDVEELTVNETDLTIDSTKNVSLSIAESAVNYVTGVDGTINGLENATVVATGAMTVNETEIDVENDDDYKVIVEDGEVVGLADISDGATVNVANVEIAAENGEYQIGEKTYTITDSVDGAFSLSTGDEGQLTGIDAFEGEMVIVEPENQSLSVNSNALEFASTAEEVTVAATGASGITAINGLVSGDAVYGALDNASIAMPGSDASVRSEASQLNVNGTTYELLNDANGVTVNGSKHVVDLDEEASLYPDQKGTYVVNGTSLEVEDTSYPIIGLDSATDAYIYDPANLIIRKGTPVSSIADMLGVQSDYPAVEGFGTAEDPLTKAESDAIFGASSTVDLDRPLEIFATNDTKETQVIPLAGTDFSKRVNLYNGPQSVTMNNAGGNLAVVEAENADGTETSGAKDITLGDMGDAVIMKAEAGKGSVVDITGGAGDDSVVVQGSAPVTFDMSEGGADKVVTFASSGARVSLEGYDALKNPNAGIQITETWTSDLADAITNGWLSFANSVLSLLGKDASGTAQINLGTNLVNLFNYKGIKQAVGFTPDEGGLVDGSTAQDPLILIGNDKNQKSGNSTLLGGSGDDTAIAGGGDTIDLGLGNNEVRLQDNLNRAGADITLAHGRTTISGFNGTFNLDHGDIIKTDLSNASVSFDGTNVYIAGSAFYGVLADVKVDGAISYDSADVTESADLVESADSTSSSVLATAAGDYTNVLFDDDGAIAKTAIAKTGGVIDVKLDSDMRANNYIGDDSGLTFYDHTGEVLVNLGEGTGSIDTDAVNYSGINKVAAGAGQTTIIGAESNETMIAGQGNDSVWGAGGKNLLLGYNDVSGDKTGQTSFFVVAEADGAANTIRGFEFVDDDNYNLNTNKITADVLDIQVQYDRIDVENGGVSLDGDNVVLFVNNRSKNSSESVIIEGARGKDFIVSGDDVIDDVIAQVNTDSLVADKFANFFVATGKNATLTVSNDIDTANIYLGGTPLFTDFDGKAAEFYGDIHVIDATGSNAKAELGGNVYDNVIMAGSGDTSLWGGDGGNDLLVGGSGKNSFFYNYGNGNDTVTGAKDGDIVDLTNIELDELTAEITSTGVELTFTDGNTLTVNSTANVEFQVAGETYVVNKDRDGWTQKA